MMAWGLLGPCSACTAAPSARRLSASDASEGSAVAQPVVPARAEAQAQAAQGRRESSANASKEALYQRGCDLGSALSCNDLGVSLERERARSRPLLERACSLGLQRGCVNLAGLLMEDEAELPRAVSLLDHACALRDPLACSGIADAAYAGHGTTRDLTRAAKNYDRACELGHFTACVSAGWMLDSGEGGAQDARRAVELFRLACERGVAAGCTALGLKGVESATSQAEFDLAMGYLKTSCEHEQALACLVLGVKMPREGGGRFSASARAAVDRACQLGLPRACELAHRLDAPDGNPADSSGPNEAE